jgi:HSP20 family protein
MSLFPRLTPFHYPSRATHRDELVPFFSLFNDTFNELQRLSDNLPATSGNSTSGGSTGFFAPKFDVKETQTAYELQGELPGIAQKDITIEFNDETTLTIKGHSEHRREQGTRPSPPSKGEEEQQQLEGANTTSTGEATNSSSTELTTSPTIDKQQLLGKHEDKHPDTYWVSERSVGEFSRSFSFPNKVDQEAVKASLKHGVLSVTVPKMTSKQPTTRRIQVEAEE